MVKIFDFAAFWMGLFVADGNQAFIIVFLTHREYPEYRVNFAKHPFNFDSRHICFILLFTQEAA